MKDLRYSYGGEEVLRGISFDSGDCRVISILGPNGTGKTTLLKCMCGLFRPDSGSVTIGGTDITKLRGRELARNVAFVPQSVPVSRMTVFDTVLMGRKPYIGWSAGSGDYEKVGEALDLLGMSHLSLKYVDQISGGEFQKAQIARAIVQEPSVLILDEPSNNLDIANQQRTMDMVSKAVSSRSMCTVMTMHDINLAVRYSDRFIFLSGGKVEVCGGREIITPELIRKVYGIDAAVIEFEGLPFVIPRDTVPGARM